MSFFCGPMIVLFCLLCSPLATGPIVVQTSSNEDSAVRKIGDYRKDLKTFVKNSKSKDEPIRFGAILNLCALHDQLVRDQRYEHNTQLHGFRAIAADRLKKCSKEIELQLLRIERKQNKNRDRLEEPIVDESFLVLRLQQRIISEDMQTMTSLTGGPVNLWQYTGNPAGPLCDHGPELVNLIESTVNPEFWRRNGGNGIIEYYQPLRIIVVGASSQIHDEMYDLLSTLRGNRR